jgi:4-amino-4-deoxy-L-arabinose transferase-like glycosyltransferase
MARVTQEESKEHRGVIHVVTVAIAALLLAGLCAWLFIWNLGSSSISSASDEVIYVRMVQSLLHEGHLFPIYHGNFPSFEKPPLKIWLAAIAPLLLGESNWSFRLLDGLCGIAAVALSVVVALRLFSESSLRRARCSTWIGGIFVGFLLLGAPEWVISHHGFRRAVLDGVLTLLTLGIALVSLADAKRTQEDDISSRTLWLIAILSSLAVLTKSVAGLVPWGCAVLSFLVLKPRALVTPRVLILFLPFVTLATYVGVLAYVGGPKAVRIFIGVEILDRAFTGFHGHNTGNRFFYLWYLFVRGAVVSRYLLLLGCIGALSGARKDQRFRWLLIWAFAPVALYSCSTSQVPWYLNPFAPFIIILALFGTISLVQQLSSYPLLARGLLAVAILIGIPTYSRALRRHIETVRQENHRLELDLFVSSLKERGKPFILEKSALSGRSNPVQGRFNVEGIYREMLKPQLTLVMNVAEIKPTSESIALCRNESLSQLPPGWRELGRARPFGTRTWDLIAVTWENEVP